MSCSFTHGGWAIGSSKDYEAGNLPQPLTSGLRACRGQTAVHWWVAVAAGDTSEDDNLEGSPLSSLLAEY